MENLSCFIWPWFRVPNRPFKVMTFRFYPEGKMTVVVRNNQAFTLSDAATSNWTRPVSINPPFEGVLPNAHKQTCNLREGKKESHYYWELPYGEGLQFTEFLKNKYGLKNRRLMFIGSVMFTLMYTTNEVGEPFFRVNAKLPKHVIIGICDCIMSEYRLSCED